MAVPLQQYGLVRIRQLLKPPEEYDGWHLNQRAPQVGDLGTSVDILQAPGLPDQYVVESSGPDGVTIFLGDFAAEELEEAVAASKPERGAMVHLGPDPTDAEMLQVAETWIDLVADGKFEEAFHCTAHDPYYQWTPDLIRLVIEGYGLPTPHPSGIRFHVTPRAATPGAPFYRRVTRYADATPPFAEILHDLPLNGEWSDLSVTFRVERSHDGSVVTLEEIHVF